MRGAVFLRLRVDGWLGERVDATAWGAAGLVARTQLGRADRGRFSTPQRRRLPSSVLPWTGHL